MLIAEFSLCWVARVISQSCASDYSRKIRRLFDAMFGVKKLTFVSVDDSASFLESLLAV